MVSQWFFQLLSVNFLGLYSGKPVVNRNLVFANILRAPFHGHTPGVPQLLA